MAIACSAVVIELPKGVFITTIPLSEAALISTLSTPIPARPITLKLLAFANISAFGLVADLTANPSYFAIQFFSSSCDNPVITSTSIPRCLNISSAFGLISSAIKTFGIFQFLLESSF